MVGVDTAEGRGAAVDHNVGGSADAAGENDAVATSLQRQSREIIGNAFVCRIKDAGRVPGREGDIIGECHGSRSCVNQRGGREKFRCHDQRPAPECVARGDSQGSCGDRRAAFIAVRAAQGGRAASAHTYAAGSREIPCHRVDVGRGRVKGEGSIIGEVPSAHRCSRRGSIPILEGADQDLRQAGKATVVTRQGRRPGSGLREGARSADRIGESDRIAPVQYQRTVIGDGPSAEGAGRPATADLKSSARDRGRARVAVVAREDLGGVPVLNQRSAATRSIGDRPGKGVRGSLRSDREGGAAERDRGGDLSGEGSNRLARLEREGGAATSPHRAVIVLIEEDGGSAVFRRQGPCDSRVQGPPVDDHRRPVIAVDLVQGGRSPVDHQIRVGGGSDDATVDRGPVLNDQDPTVLGQRSRHIQSGPGIVQDRGGGPGGDGHIVEKGAAGADGVPVTENHSTGSDTRYVEGLIADPEDVVPQPGD